MYATSVVIGGCVANAATGPVQAQKQTDHDHAEHTSYISNTRTTSITEFAPEPFQMSGVIAGRVTVPHGAVIVTRSVIGAHRWCGDTPQTPPERVVTGAPPRGSRGTVSGWTR